MQPFFVVYEESCLFPNNPYRCGKGGLLLGSERQTLESILTSVWSNWDPDGAAVRDASTKMWK